jgi:alpha-glucosidase
MALLLCLPGSACLFQGEELGLPNAEIPRERMRDPFGLRFYPAYLGRDGARTPIPWTAGAPNLGFSRAAETWLPAAPTHDRLAVDLQQRDPTSTLAAYRSMLAWRKRHLASIAGDVTLLPVPDPLLAFQRGSGAEAIVAIFNLAAEAVEIPIADLPKFRVVTDLAFVTRPKGATLALPPYGVTLGIAAG